jgi:ATP-binding cassette subfamily C protein
VTGAPRHSPPGRALTRVLRRHRRRAAAALALALAQGFTEWIGLLLLVPLLAIVGLADDAGGAARLAERVGGVLAAIGVPRTLPAVLALFVALVALRAWVQRRAALAGAALERDVAHDLRLRLYAAATRTRWAFFARQRATDLVHTLTGELDRVRLAVSQALRLAEQGVLAAVYLLVALRLSPPMTALAALAGGTLLIALRGSRRRARATGERLGAAGAELHAAVSEHLGGLKTARGYNAERRNADAFAAIARACDDAEASADRHYAPAAALLAVGSALALGAYVYVAFAWLRLPTTAVLLLLLVFSRLVPRFTALLDSWQYLVGALPALDNVLGWIARCDAESEGADVAEVAEAADGAEASSGAKVAERAVMPPAVADRIRLDGVRFRYDPDRDPPVLDGVTLDIPARRTTALVGPSGAGKSTIADLLLGLLTPDAGTITVDGVPLTPGALRAWRDRIGFVPQDTFLLHDTVRANLRWAAPGASEPELHEALRLAAADGFVAALPQGLDTRIGDRGVLLSGGERQRLALARALLRRPALLVLDEATSALDAENERRIQQALAALHGQLTMLVITHRLAAIRGADRIHVLDAGRIVQSGTWDDLLADRAGRFAALCRAQGLLDD